MHIRLHLEQFSQQHWYPVYQKLAAKFRRANNSVQQNFFGNVVEYKETLQASTRLSSE